MHDIKFIQNTPEAFDKAMQRRGLPAQSPDILALDLKRRTVMTRLQELQSRRNAVSKDIGLLKAKKENTDALMAEVAQIKTDMEGLEAQDVELNRELEDVLSRLPNMQAADIPDGADETANKVVRAHGEPVRLPKPAPDHVAIGEALRMMDFETAAKISGTRFVWLQNGLARLERALAQFMLDTHTQEHGYTEVSPPILVKDAAVFGTGNLPKFAEDLFKTTTGHWVIPTAEVSLTNYVADMIVEEENLPLRFTAMTPCFRSEAGSAGRDTRGMLRQHQFYKVELVSITAPEDSVAEHERMTACAETILKKLGLTFRTVMLCTGDAGFCSYKTYDLEVWLPGQQTYREISSCSNCTDFQARRMKARTRKAGEKETRFVHTLNGSGVAVGRALIAVMENYWNADTQELTIPDVLQPYMGGLKVLKA